MLSHDGHEFVVHDYFRGEKRAAISSPDGAHLTGDIVNALTGHVQYAQAVSGIAAAQVIGHVTKLSGSATAIRNGVSVILNNGDNVEKGDVVSTGGDSTLGITFIDGTVFGLSSNARMVLNEMVYDPNGSNNSSLLSLVAGTITFVAGETAKHGDMKVDTPVATMGIRGTAVLSQINFVVPAGGGDPQPQASFQVLVEPNGTTGSYILFDKVTLLPIATVNQAGQMIQISGGNVSISNALMSPDIQKLITDVFTLKFTDNNSNTKLTTNFTDSITQTSDGLVIKTAAGYVAIPTFVNLNQLGVAPQLPVDHTTSNNRIPGPPNARSLDLNGNVQDAFALAERADKTGDTADRDTVSGKITFLDFNQGDRPTVKVDLAEAPNYSYKDAGLHDVTASLTALQKQDIAATQIDISVDPTAGNDNNGSAIWTYTLPDHVFDFLAAGETLTLIYRVRVDNNFAANNETTYIPITITITGTNDKPVITTSVPTITFEGGTSVPGGPLTSDVPTTGTLSFDDVDLTDKHTVSVALTSATLPDGTVPPGPLAAFQSAMSVAIAAGADSTGDGTGTINWSLANLPVYLADFIPKGEVLTLTYTVTLTDSQGAISQQTITVTITGHDAPAVVWIATEHAGAPSGGFWKDAANWETGTVPTIDDDVIVITDQLHGLTPSYPVTIDAPAYAKSLTMNDYDTTVSHTAPEVINKSALTIAGEISLRADSKLTNFAAGTISVGGKAEFLDSSVLTNAGYLTLAGGGDFTSGTTITNSGTIELSGSALKTLAGIHNAGGTLKAGAGTTLIVDTATISGGTVTIVGTLELDGTSVIKDGTLNNSGAVNVKGAADFAHETVGNGGGIITVFAAGALSLSGVTLTGGSVNNLGTVEITGNSSLVNSDFTNHQLTVDGGTTLTLSGTTVTGGTVTDTGIIHVAGSSAINSAAVSGGGITVDALTTLTLDDTTVTGTTITNDGTVKIDASKKLSLNGASLTGGALIISGTLESVGTSAIDDADITNTGTITVISGTLTIDPATTHAITNHNLIQANGGVLDVSGEDISNTADLKAINYGTLKLTNLTVTNSGAGTVTVDGHSKLYLTDVSINGGSLSNAGNLYSVSGPNTVTAAVTNTGAIEVQAGTLNLAGGLSGIGSLTIDNGATLELAGATAQTVTFAGGTDTLQLDKVAGQSFTGTIAGQSTKAGTFTIKGAADITTTSGDALDFTASGGTSAAPANIVLTPTGALTGAANGLVVTQNGTGGISLTATGDIKGLAGHGIWLRDSATGAGAITVNNVTGVATGAGAGSAGVLVEKMSTANTGSISITQLGGAAGGDYGIDATTHGDGNITVAAGGNITGSLIYGIRARSYGAGSETITTAAGSLVTSGSSGIVAVNRTTSLGAASGSTITVNAYGTINSGSSLNQSGNAPAGIQAGYSGATTGAAANTGVNGSVLINNHANITAAAGYGIHAYNYGNGNVTVNDAADTTVVGAEDGIRAQALSGGTGDVSVTLGAGASVTGTTSYGILAYSIDAGDISVTMASGDSITSGSSGIVAVNYATAIASSVGSTISVEAHGIIHSGSSSNNDGTIPGGIIAGYKPGGTGTFSSAVKGDVTVTSDATIIADAGYGIEAFTWGAGNLTVTTGATSSITAAAGIAIGAFDHGGGDVKVTNNGSATGTVGLAALANGSGDVTIINHGGITSTSLAGISVTQNEVGATGSTHITNTGSIVAPSAHAAIFIQENTAGGSALIDNFATGTIGPAVASAVTSTTYAIVETGGAITINNAGHINGNISVATAAFNNELGGTWTVAGSGVFGNASSIVNHGAIDLHGASISGTGLSIENYKDIDSWGTASISGIIANTGSIEVHTGALTLFGSLSGSGSVTVDVGALLKLDGTVTQTITLDGDGAHLQIDTSTFSGSIAALSANDTIDLSSIVYDDGTSATYNAATGELVVSDAHNHTITLKLTGADYSNAHFAGSSDGHGGTLITFNAADAAPAFTAAGATLTAIVPELANTTGSSALDPTPTAATGSIDFKDVDLTDRPTASITGQTVSWTGADHTTNLSGFLTTDQTNALEYALSLQTTGKNNGMVTWNYSIADSSLDFLAEGQTATVVSTVTLDDHQGQQKTADVTITIAGKNDAPTLNNATLSAINEDTSAPAGSTVGTLFAGFHDADAGASFKAVAITASHATAAQGVWQYEIAGSNQWVDISGVSNISALVLATDTLIRFVPAANYSGTPGSLDVHALDDTYGANVMTPVLVDITSPGIGSSVSAQAATLSTEVNPVADSPTVSINHTPIADAGEFLVNTTSANDQTYSAVGALSDGGYVIAWVSQGQDGDGTGIYAQHYDNSGAKVGGEFRVNTATAGDQSSPYVVGLEGGGFVASWTSGSNNGATIHLQRYDSSGSPAGGEVSLSGYGENATLAALSNGGFVITYVASDSSTSGTYAVVYDASGTATSGPLLINTTTASQQQGDSVAGTADGGFVASWHSYGQDGDGWGVYFQRFDAQGNKLGGEVQVNTHTAGDQYGGELTVLKDGSIVVSYYDANALVLRHFSSTGAPIGSEVSISDATTDTLQALPDGGFLVTYQGHDVPGSLGLLGQRFDASLHSVGSSFVINETTAGDQVFLADRSSPTAVTTDGKIVSTWFSPGVGGHDVEARVFTVPGFGSEGNPIKLPAITAAITDTDGSETLLIKLSGYPAGATFSIGHLGAGADAGHWLIDAADIGSLATPRLTMTAPVGYQGEFNLHVGVTVTDAANGLNDLLTDTKTVTSDVAINVYGGPVIDTTSFHVTHNSGNTDTIIDLAVIEADAGASAHAFTVVASTAPLPLTNSSVDLSPTSGSLSAINAGLANGITYHPGGTPPDTDQITLKVTDTTTGRYDTVHFIFNEAGDTSQGITLQGTSGKDVIFATQTGDTLTGGGGKDQFVFAPGSTGDNAQHTITDFVSGLDRIDLRQFSDVGSVSNLTITQPSGDTLVTFSHQISASVTEQESILLKNMIAGNLKASDFIFHA
ncbi:VCBS domain-containing protein [Bradyrhizobium sp. 149]|uniref:VCBS domain-containing protein n=1 Tax=Bradyrhizobium sp. 149 TaxID=2782624 RepID=UPI001FF83B9C